MRVRIDPVSFKKGDKFYAKVGLGDVAYLGPRFGFGFLVLDKKKFMLAVVKYNIQYTEVSF